MGNGTEGNGIKKRPVKARHCFDRPHLQISKFSNPQQEPNTMKCEKCGSDDLIAGMIGTGNYIFINNEWEFQDFDPDCEPASIQCEKCGHVWEEVI
jgi:hypothetical protein